jgi:predicted Fe-Mo cluster-binding NifX family protein
MKFAVALIDSAPAFHFGKANDFKIITLIDGTIISTDEIHDEVSVHQARPQYLKNLGVEALICNGVGSGAFERLSALDIKVFGFNELSVGEAIHQYTLGKLLENTDVFECKC